MKIPATIVAALAIYFAISTVPPDALAFTALISPDVIMFTTIATIGTVVSREPLIYRDGISPLLQETLGIKLGKSTIAKLFSPAVGQGCEPAAYWNKRPLYRPSDVIAWAKSRLRPCPAMMSMSAEETPESNIPRNGGDEPAAPKPAPITAAPGPKPPPITDAKPVSDISPAL
jgi:hypothetical protein